MSNVALQGLDQDSEERCFETLDKRPRVLAKWFYESRERWKQKYRERMKEINRLKVRVSDVSKSREQWKEKAVRKERELAELKAEVDRLQQELQRDDLKIASRER
jgi:hypothetical protein